MDGSYMKYQGRYQEWLDHPSLDEDAKKELRVIQDQEIEIQDRFYKDLTFGTGGLRGLIGCGSNRINKYTVRRATQGLVNYIEKNKKHSDKKGVAIAYDSRNYSCAFALEAALVLAANGLRAYLFDDLRPTPELSYAVRLLGCTAGIVITASHNPPEYNGYKVYDSDGGQITLDMANGIINEINAIHIFNDVKTLEPQEAIDRDLIHYIGEEIDKAYLSEVTNLSLKRDIAREVPEFKIVYTPLHGAGLKLITKALSMLGYNSVHLVTCQVEPDGMFPTCKSPNPEEKEAFQEGIKIAEQIGADILLGTDPDCDRVGVVVKDRLGQYQVLTGNQIGALLTHYILSSRENVTSHDAVIKTIVTSDLGARIAKSYGATVIDTLTGFKFIGEKIKEFEEEGTFNFLFGYEESYGYLAGTFVRDKDAVIASVLIVEMAAYYKSKGMSLSDAIEEIYKDYGYYSDALESFTFKGVEGQKKIKETVEKYRDYNRLKKAFAELEFIEDYQSQIRSFINSGKEEKIELPKTNVIKVYFKDQSWFAIRPSGTEPKLKIYYSTIGKYAELAEKRMEQIKEWVKNLFANIK